MSDTVTLSSGISFKLAPLQPLFYQAFITKLDKDLPLPEVPFVLLKTMDNPDGELQPNPDDPDYIKAVEIRKSAYGDRLLNALIVMGLEDIELPEDNSWLRKLEYLGIDIDTNSPEAVKVAYVRNVALRTIKDIESITDAILSQVTVTEEAVEKHTASFRS